MSSNQNPVKIHEAVPGKNNNTGAAPMPTAVYCTDQKGLITFYNEKAAEMWGRHPRLHDPTELLFCGSWKLYYPNGQPMEHKDCPMAVALKTEKSVRGQEISIERPDGSRMSALVSIDPIYDAEGKLKGAINVFYDITERKSLEEDQARLAAIVESSEDAIVSKTLNGVITSWNKGAEKIFGYSSNEMVGKSITLLIPPDRLSEEDFILGKIGRGERVESFETIRMRKDGTMINISVTISPIRNSSGRIIGASKIARDITEQKAAQEKLQIYSEKLEQLNFYKDEFISLASHELKTPITVIRANLQLTQMALENNPTQGFVDKALISIDKLSALVAEMLDISKIQSGKLELNMAPFTAREMIEDCIENISLAHTSHKIINKVDLGNTMMIADRQRLEQVVINLLTNAIKYSPDADKVVVEADAEDNHLHVAVEDFGIGIPADQMDKVFTRFFRVEDLKASYAGLGIGLYISKEIVDRHNGQIWVESELGKGSVFHFKVPLQQPS